jgi:lipopolysaccharide transport protein LptA
MKVVLTALLLLRLFSSTYANEPPKPASPSAPRKKIDRPPTGQAARDPKKVVDRPIQITADTFLAESKDNLIRWKGNVLVVRDEMTIRCDSLVALYDENKRVKTVTCSGNVHMHQPASANQHEARDAWGGRAVFDNDTGLLTVTGDPHAREGNNKMKGDQVFYDTSVDRLRLEGHVLTEVEPSSDKNPLVPRGSKEATR